MLKQKERLTKEKIFDTAVILFSEEGYKNVSMRDIAKVVGIKASSLYNHYSSKEEILYSLLDFYLEHWQQKAPSTEELLSLVETSHPYEVLKLLSFRFDPDLQDRMNRILLIAIREMFIDTKCEELVGNCHVNRMVLKLVLDRMVELGKIEPLDTSAINTLAVNYALGAATINGTNLKIDWDEWLNGFHLIFSLIKPVE